jgi:hypothetical protein
MWLWLLAVLIQKYEIWTAPKSKTFLSAQILEHFLFRIMKLEMLNQKYEKFKYAKQL